MTYEIFHRGVMTFRNLREHCGRLDCACSAKRVLAFELVSKILRARVDGMIWRRSMEVCLVVLLPR